MIEYFFPLKFGGLGDKFMMMSCFLTHRNRYKKESKLILIDSRHEESPFQIQPQMFKSIVDFFHFERPSFDMDYEIVTHDDETLNIWQINDEIYGFKNIIKNLLEHGSYWPIKFSRKKTYDFCWMFYIADKFSDYLPEKILYEDDLKLFKDRLSHPFYDNLKYIRLEDFNFARNVEILASSDFLISCEGMWTHLSRAMKIPTIAYTNNEDFLRNINDQGHFASPHFVNCVTKLLRNYE